MTITVRDNGVGIAPEDAAAHLRDVQPRRARHGARAGRPGHRPRAARTPRARCTAARSTRDSDGPGQGQRVHAAPAAGRATQRRTPSRGDAAPRAAASRASASSSWTTTATRPTASAWCCELLGADVRVARDGPEALEAFDALRARGRAARHRHAGHGRLRGRARASARAIPSDAPRSSRSPAGARSRTAAARARRASTTTWSSPRTSARCRSCSRRWTAGRVPSSVCAGAGGPARLRARPKA